MKPLLPISLFLLTIIVSCSQSPKQATKNTVSNPIDSNTIKKLAVVKPGLYFANLKNSDTVKSPVTIQMGIRGMTVEPAGKLNTGKGHYALIIDGSFIEKGKQFVKDKTHFNFETGQISDTLKLKSGEHVLTLQFVDGLNQSYGPEWTSSISIIVEKQIRSAVSNNAMKKHGYKKHST